MSKGPLWLVGLAVVLSLAAVAAPSDAVSGPEVVIVGGPSAVSPAVAAQLMECTTGSVVRYSGTNRYETAAVLSEDTVVSASEVYLATGTGFADATSAGPVAGADAAPILLTRPDTLPGPVAAELARINPDKVVILGGENAISPAVEHQIGAAADRVAGPNRYATAAAVAARAFPSGTDTVFIATGEDYPDALAAAPAAASRDAPILLVGTDAIPAPTTSELLRLDPDTIIIVGGTGAVSAAIEAQLAAFADTARWWGSNRYATAAKISEETFDPGVDTIFIATGEAFPDALAAGAAAGAAHGPVLLVRPDSIPGPTAVEIARLTGVACPAGPPSEPIVLRGDGLGIVDFGTPPAETLTILTPLLGNPSHVENLDDVGSYLTYWRFYAWAAPPSMPGIDLTNCCFERIRAFTGWALGGNVASPTITTAEGIAVGSTGPDLLAAYGSRITVFSPQNPSECGPGNRWHFYLNSDSGTIGGTLTGDPTVVTTRIDYLEAGFPDLLGCVAP